MATLYKTRCDSCSEEAEISWGDGMFYLQYQCKCCLKLFHLPRNAPRQNRNGREVPKFLVKDGFKSFPPTPTNQIIRFSVQEIVSYLNNQIQWQYGDDEWDTYEIDQILSLVSCECESDLVATSKEKIPKLKCQTCNSSRLQTHCVGSSD